MKTKYAILPIVALIVLTTFVSGCSSINPLSGGNNNTSGVPVYEPSVKTATVNTSQGRVTTYQTTSSPTQVADFYRTEMANRGYQASASYQPRVSSVGSDVVLSFVKGTGTVHVAVATILSLIHISEPTRPY